MANQRNKVNENPIPVNDEGWWASVLAEEGRNLPPPPARAQKAEPRTDEPARQTADWEQVKELYSHDQIVTLNVTGHNRGGLLVEGSGMYGFVPFSHLIELAGRPEVVDRDGSLEAYMGRSLKLEGDRMRTRGRADRIFRAGGSG